MFVSRLNRFKHSSTLIDKIHKMSTNKVISSHSNIKLLSQDEAINLDKELFEEYHFSVDQLMELAGLSVAQVISKVYPVSKYPRPVVCCGPGNNGGDGLVAARHLEMFGYEPIVICPKLGRGHLFENLMTQCRKFDIETLTTVPDNSLDKLGNLIVDAVFGFSFKPPNRSDVFAKLLAQMARSSSSDCPLVCVDIPSGWNVESGDGSIESDHANVDPAMRIPALKPDCLISLTAPKKCAAHFAGRHHFLGGRFCPPALHDKYELNLPQYPDCEGIVRLK